MIKSVLDHLKLRKYILIGHSMGGYVSLAFAELFPNNINGFCLMNSTALSDTGEKKKNRDRAVKAVKHNLKTFVRMAIPNLFSEKNRTLFIDEIKIITQEALQISKQGIIASLEGMKIRKDRTFLLNSTKFPILMIISKMDPVLDYNSLLAQVQKSKAEFVELTDGHMSHIENKEELISAIKKFVK
jgi:pimeloyl-ACP methyl ester carboxylesterase